MAVTLLKEPFSKIFRGVPICNETAFRYSDDDTLHEGDESEYVLSSSYTDIIEPNEPRVQEASTGLSQSKESLYSCTYAYGNQREHENGPHGYNLYEGCSDDRPCYKMDNVNRPKTTSKMLKDVNKHNVSVEVLQDGPLLSDLMLCKKTTSRDDDDSIQEEQNRLGNSIPRDNETCDGGGSKWRSGLRVTSKWTRLSVRTFFGRRKFGQRREASSEFFERVHKVFYRYLRIGYVCYVQLELLKKL